MGGVENNLHHSYYITNYKVVVVDVLVDVEVLVLDVVLVDVLVVLVEVDVVEVLVLVVVVTLA